MKKLERNEMKKLKGGVMAPGTCGVMVVDQSTGQRYVSGYGVNMSSAQNTAGSQSGWTFMDSGSGHVMAYDGHWCCDSCANFPIYSNAS